MNWISFLFSSRKKFVEIERSAEANECLNGDSGDYIVILFSLIFLALKKFKEKEG